MKKYKRFNTILIVFVLFLSFLLIYLLFPTLYWGKAILAILLPLSIFVIVSRLFTRRRLKLIRSQLLQILHTLEEFDMDDPRQLIFEESVFPIFNELNDYLIELIDRIRVNYQANKQFTQNASHELQTPLAIIKGNAELLLQSPNVGEKEMKALGVILQMSNRLSKLNSALILLSKIEHQRFVDVEKVDIKQTTLEVLSNFNDLIEMQGLEIRSNFLGNFQVEMSSTLAETLIANLVQNAIRHNTGDFVEIEIGNHYFKISNPGNPPETAPDNLFKRFKRESEKEESLGLGLSIAKQICGQYDLYLEYFFEKGLHVLKLQSETHK